MFHLIKSMAVAIIVFAAALPVGNLAVVEPVWHGWNPCLPGLTPEVVAEESARSIVYASKDFPGFWALVAFAVSLSGIVKFEFERVFWPLLIPIGLFLAIFGQWARSPGANRWPDGLLYMWEQAAALTLIVLLWKVPVKEKYVLSLQNRRTADGQRGSPPAVEMCGVGCKQSEETGSKRALCIQPGLVEFRP